MPLTQSTGRTFALLALSGAALVLGYPPFSIPLIPFVGIVPLLWFLDGPRSNRDVALGSLAFAVPYFLGTTGWLFLLARFTPSGAAGAAIAFVLHLGTFAFFPAALVLLRRTARAPVVLAAPAFWAVSEHARTFGDLDFAWTTIGSSLSDWPALIQHADLIGVWGLSVWIVAVNALVATAISSASSRRGRLSAVLAAAALVGAPVVYGVARRASLRTTLAGAPRLRVAAVQPNIAQELKWSPAAREANLATLNRIIHDAESGSPDLVVAPEACLPLVVAGDAARLPTSVATGTRPLLLGMVRGMGSLVPVEEDGVRGHRYESHRNSAVLAAPDRTILAVHDKTTLVPMTEAIPFRDVFGFLLPFMRAQFGRFEPGGPAQPLEIAVGDRAVGLGALICFEILHEHEVADVVARGADVLVNITNDAWFGRSNMPWHHMGLSVVRAIETRRSVVRSANTGISALVDPLGNVTARTALFEEAVLRGEVPLSPVRTVYARVGNLLLWAAYAAAGVFLLGVFRTARARPRASD